VIVRPTIVGATLKEPLRGWIDNYSGATGLFVACGMGLLRTMLASPVAVANLVPVDFVTDVIIAAPWFKQYKMKIKSLRSLQDHGDESLESVELKPWKQDEDLVIHCESGHLKKPLLWETIPRMIEVFYAKSPFDKAVRYPGMRTTNNRLKYKLYILLCHYAPAMMFDALLKCTGQKAKLYTMYTKLHKSLKILDFFTQRHWQFDVNNLHEMDQLLQDIKNSSDKPAEQAKWTNEWNVSIKGLDWSKYIEFYCLGTKKYLMKEEMSKMGKARIRMNRMRLVHYLIVTFTAAVTAKMTQLLIQIMVKLYKALESRKILSTNIIQKISELSKNKK